MITDKKLASPVFVLALAHALVAGAAFFAPYDPAEQHRDAPFAPPARVHFVDRRGHFHLRPYGCAWIHASPDLQGPRYVEDCSRVSPWRFFVRSSPASAWHFVAPDGPAPVFLLGTDDYGRDQLSRLLVGGQVSLFAGWLATALSLALGLVAGAAAGYFGGWLDDAIMRATEVFMALPWIYLLFAARAFLPLDLGPRQTFFLIVAIVGLAGWARPARLVRGVVLTARERDFVRAARGFGAGDAYILRCHVLPEAASVVVTQAVLLVPQSILAEVTLSFFGLGVGEPIPSWGNMLAALARYYVLRSYWWMFLPGLALVLIFLVYNALADRLLARFEPARAGHGTGPAGMARLGEAR